MIRRIFFAAALVAIWLGLFLFAAGVPWNAPISAGRQLTMEGRDFYIRTGAGEHDAEGLVVTRLGDDGTALQTASLGRARAEQLRILRYRIRDFPRTLELALMFRRTDAADDVETISLPSPSGGEVAVDLSTVKEWQGEIREIGFAEYPTSQLVPPSAVAFEPFHIDEVRLQAPSWGQIVPRLRNDWTGYRPWSQRSINTLGAQIETVPSSSLTATMGAGCALSVLAGWLILRWPRRRLLEVALATSITAWVLLDASWLADLAGKHATIEGIYAGKTWSVRETLQPDEKTFSAAGAMSRIVAKEKAERVLVLSDSSFTLLRMIYFLLPIDAVSLEQAFAASPDSVMHAGTLIAVVDCECQYDAASGLLTKGATTYPVTPVVEQGDLRVYRPREVAQ